MKKVVYFTLAILVLGGMFPLITGNQTDSPSVDIQSEKYSVSEESGTPVSGNFLDSNKIKIVYPLFSMPAIVAEGREFYRHGEFQRLSGQLELHNIDSL